MSIKIFNFFGGLTIIIAIFALFAVKDRANNVNYQVMQMTKELEHEKDKIHLLKAEFTYLRSPERIRSLAEKFLVLSAIKSSQIIKDPLISDNMSEAPIKITLDNLNNKMRKKIRWRYKKSHGKYLQTVSLKH